MKIPLEDNFNDLLGKAQRGLALTADQIAARAQISLADWQRACQGEFDEAVVRRLAPVLGLGTETLVALGRKAWYPADPGSIPGLAMLNTPYGDMAVNSFVVWDPATKAAVFFDTGADATGMLRLVAEQGLQVELILLTHSHVDHVAQLAEVKAATGAPAWIGAAEHYSAAQPFTAGREFTVGGLRIGTRATSGHSPGGITYVISGLSRPVAVVGDSLFASSMGGGKVSYSDALRNNREQILTLPEDTVLCPGHGPLTTVGEEKRHNPFFT